MRGAPPGNQEDAQPLAAILLAATLTVLVIACANVANLLIVRGVATGRETAIRVALGASRGRLVRQTLVESAVLAAAGGSLGLLLSMWSTELLLRFADVPLEADFTPDRRVLLFSIGLSALTALLFGVAPALRRASMAPAASLKTERGSGDARPRSRLQSTLVAGQLALSLVLLLAAGMFLKGLANARTFDVGFDPQNRVSMSFNLRMHGYSDDRAVAFQQVLLDRARSMPRVRVATLATLVPLGGKVFVSDVAFRTAYSILTHVANRCPSTTSGPNSSGRSEFRSSPDGRSTIATWHPAAQRPYQRNDGPPPLAKPQRPRRAIQHQRPARTIRGSGRHRPRHRHG